MSKVIVALSVAASVWAAAGLSPVHAADLDHALLAAPELPVTKPVEVGTGWYLRGDLGYAIGTSGSDFDSHWSGSAGAGYHFTDYLRADITVEYTKGSFAGSGTQTFRSWGGMVNGYFDLGTFAGFTPYLGGGAGYVNVDWHNFTDATSTTHPGLNDWRFAWQLSAGVAYSITKNLRFDVGYRYMDVNGGGRYVDAAGNHVKDSGFGKSEVRAGLRYDIW